ncbi:unnamed protein product [Mesocestoides corti]|uniref:Cyclic nucleotide-binding domain-containing protein n=1 Tax=Mesocestoides corti TaxID=53468 RepID=A0A158QUD7_MESCO|nr:unnamed protein product [Mesocestoides corti]
MLSRHVASSSCIPPPGVNKKYTHLKDASSAAPCSQLSLVLPCRSSTDTSLATNLGSEDAFDHIHPAMSDQRNSGETTNGGAVSWPSFGGAPPRNLFDEEVKQSSPSMSKTSQGERFTNTSRDKVGLPPSSENSPKRRLILVPDGRPLCFWSGIMCVACLYNMWTIPYRSAFDEVKRSTALIWFTMDYFADALYLADLLFGFRVAYLESGILQTHPRKIRQHYINSARFYLDCLCILPLDLLYISVGVRSILRLLRFVKVYKLIEYMKMFQRRTVHPNTFRTMGWCICVLTGIHWNACFYQCAMEFLSPPINSTVEPLERYLQSTYTSLLCLALRKPTAEVEAYRNRFLYALLIFEGLVGVTMLTMLIANANMIIANGHKTENEFQRQLGEVKAYLVRRKAPETLRRRIICWFDYLKRQSQIPDEQRVFKYLPDRLKAEVAIHVHLDMLKRVDLFQDTEEGFLVDLVLRLRPALFCPGDFICRKGEVGREMFLVSQGKLNVLAENENTVLATLGPGSYFGEISILNMGSVGNRRTASVRSLGYSDLFCLSKEDLWEVLNEYPSAREKLEKVALKRLSSCRNQTQSAESSADNMNSMEIRIHPQRSFSTVSSVSRRFPLPSQPPPPPLPPVARIGLKRRRSALSAASSYLLCQCPCARDRHTSLVRSFSTITSPLLHRQFSLQYNYGDTFDSAPQSHRRTTTLSANRLPNTFEEFCPSQFITTSSENTNNSIPQIRFERAATPVARQEPVEDLKPPPVQFGIPEDIQGEEQNQTYLQLPESSDHLYTNSGPSSLPFSNSAVQSAQLAMFMELQQRVATLEAENRILSMCLLQSTKAPGSNQDAGEKL